MHGEYQQPNLPCHACMNLKEAVHVHVLPVRTLLAKAMLQHDVLVRPRICHNTCHLHHVHVNVHVPGRRGSQHLTASADHSIKRPDHSVKRPDHSVKRPFSDLKCHFKTSALRIGVQSSLMAC